MQRDAKDMIGSVRQERPILFMSVLACIDAGYMARSSESIRFWRGSTNIAPPVVLMLLIAALMIEASRETNRSEGVDHASDKADEEVSERHGLALSSFS